MVKVNLSDLKEAKEMCYFPCVSPFLKMSGADTIFTPFSPAHIWNVLLVFTVCSRFRAILLHFPCIPFPGLLLPPHPGAFHSVLLHSQDRESGPPFEEQDGEREPEKASTGCDTLKE